MTKKTKVTVLLATCDRYETTLPLCLMSIFNQSYAPDRVVLVDDSKQKKFYEYPMLKNILVLFKERNIAFDYFYGQCKGAVPALQAGLDEIEDGWVFKTDDDNILSCDTLETFVKNIAPNIGAMSGIIVDKYLYTFYKDNPDKRPTGGCRRGCPATPDSLRSHPCRSPLGRKTHQSPGTHRSKAAGSPRPPMREAI